MSVLDPSYLPPVGSPPSMLDLLSKFKGGIGGVITTVRPDDRFPVIPRLTGRCSPSVEPMFQNLRPPGDSMTAITISKAIKAAMVDMRPPLDDMRGWHELLGKYPHHMRHELEKRYFGMGGLSGKELAMERRREREKDFRDVEIAPYLERVRRTIGLTLHECAHPAPDASPDEIQERIAEALRLIWHQETAWNFAHDFYVENGQTLRAVEEKYQTEIRVYRGYQRDRSNLFANLCRRFEDEFRLMRELEFRLRDGLAEPDSREFEHDNNFYRLIVNACFDSALTLEANFEDHVFGEADHSELRSS